MDEYALCVLKGLMESFITHNIKGYNMNLNNLTNKQLENKIKTRRLQINKDDTKAMELVLDILSSTLDISLKTVAIDEILNKRLDAKNESLGYIDEITEVLENQIWMQNRNK